ncbi:TetR family transcriptional regulator [Niveispirillum cyanobacteriorum]|uniref:TetR family transcriptional regulator n=2 Tax=Niveispirillum cyanobacteriorum TaxID=1612173 RepID=A0A2K9NIG4_9PROT|nr:TetR family transcriptional regulator [Niveispirillum cyanobacteriorum]
MEQILDEAEYLFSKHGLYGVTLKDVAQRVGVHHTLLNYYFEDKKKLFDAVFARRAAVTSERRMTVLDEYEKATAGKPTVEGALHAFLDTDLDLYIEGGEGWKNYAALGAQVANTPEWGAELMDKLSGGLCKSDDFAAVKARMAAFMAAGFKEVCKVREG